MKKFLYQCLLFVPGITLGKVIDWLCKEGRELEAQWLYCQLKRKKI